MTARSRMRARGGAAAYSSTGRCVTQWGCSTKAVLRRLNEDRLNADLLEALLEALHASEAAAEAEARLPMGAFLVFLPGLSRPMRTGAVRTRSQA